MNDPTLPSGELRRAAQICNRAKALVEAIAHQARKGRVEPASFDAAQGVIVEMRDSVARNGQALVSFARLKSADDYGAMHSVAVAAMMIALGSQLGLDEEQTHAAGLAGLLHDLGKAALPLPLLIKSGKLTEQESEMVKNYPTEAKRFLQGLQGHQGISPAVLGIVLDVCLHHNERLDGSGYPEGLKGNEISLFARMCAVCSVYDAITSNRPYKSGEDPARSLNQMARWAEGSFEPRIFQAFVKSMGIYPVGSVVRLKSGRVAVVAAQSASLLKPVVQVFYSVAKSARIQPEQINLSSERAKDDKIIEREDPKAWGAFELNRLWMGEVARELMTA